MWENDAASLFLKYFQHAWIQDGSTNSSYHAEHLKIISDSATLQECRYDFLIKVGRGPLMLTSDESMERLLLTMFRLFREMAIMGFL